MALSVQTNRGISKAQFWYKLLPKEKAPFIKALLSFLISVLHFINLFHVCGHRHLTVCLWRSEENQRSWFQGSNSDLSLGSKHLHTLSHLTGKSLSETITQLYRYILSIL